MPDSNLTKKALAQALKELMKKEPFSKISVGDICAACGMNRKSFYYHFKDKYDLVTWIFTTEYLDGVQLDSFSSGWDLFEDLSLYLYRERDFYRPAFQISGQNSFTSYFSETAASLVQRLISRLYPQVKGWTFWDVTLSFVAEAALPSFFSWLTQQEELEVEEFLEITRVRLLELILNLFRGQEPAGSPKKQ